MTQEKRKLRVRDGYGGYTLEGVYQLAKPYIKRKCDEAGIKMITRWDFSQIVREYFDIAFTYAIYRFREVELRNLGMISVVKRLQTERNPSRWITEKDEDGNKTRRLVKYPNNNTDGYFYFMYWKFPVNSNSWEFCLKFKPAKRWMKKVHQMLLEKNDYPEVDGKVFR